MIFDGTAITGNPGSFFIIAPSSSGGGYRLSGFKLNSACSGSCFNIRVDNNWSTLRIDNIEDNSGSKFLDIGGINGIFHYVWDGGPDFNQKLLVDNITKHNGQFMKVYGRSFLAWAEDDGWGTNDFIVIENCKLSYDAFPQGGMIDGESGAKFVFRYNDVTNGWFTYHDFANVRWRGSRAFEVYNNKWTCSGDPGGCGGLYPFAWRGGTGLMYNNAATGYYSLYGSELFRVAYPSCPTTGTTTICRNYWMHCLGGTNDGHLCYSSDSECPGGGHCSYTGCTSNNQCLDRNGNADYCIREDGGGTGNYPCRDQQGRGKEDPTTGIQSLMPGYFWNNTLDGTIRKFPVEDDYISEGRDYCNHSPATNCGSKLAWSYTPLACPDIRTGLSGACDSTKYGTEGYPLKNISDSTPPAAPSGLNVQ